MSAHEISCSRVARAAYACKGMIFTSYCPRKSLLQVFTASPATAAVQARATNSTSGTVAADDSLCCTPAVLLTLLLLAHRHLLLFVASSCCCSCCCCCCLYLIVCLRVGGKARWAKGRTVLSLAIDRLGVD